MAESKHALLSEVSTSFQYGSHTVTLGTGRVARQADGAVIVSSGGTMVLVTAVAGKQLDPTRGFFPLTVNYQERMYASGSIPGGFFKREGRPTERETLISRLIDRPIRPLFPDDYMYDIQVIATLMSVDPAVGDPDVLAIIGASAALAIAGVPFQGPIAAARVGIDAQDQYTLDFPMAGREGAAQAERLNLVVAGTQDAVLMVESEAKELTEAQMLGAVTYGHTQMQSAIAAIRELAAKVGASVKPYTPASSEDGELDQRVAALVGEPLAAAYQITDKTPRYETLSALKARAIETLATGDEAAPTESAVTDSFKRLEKRVVRDRILQGERRIDGRKTDEIRPITVEPSVLDRTHGSALFTRGETQAIVVATLGTERDAQMIETFTGETKDHFMLHYNFPPYCVGEVGFMSGPKRREIGHGKLAKRALAAMMPTLEAFPYSIRLVSEVTESNGSSSMATVCGGSLALMDAGVPLKAPVAGIAMGLVKQGDRYVVLSDILGDEDHLGDMDFKVAGTEQGITALQMDIKINGITEDIMREALAQARAGRQHILGIMAEKMTEGRAEVSEHAPRYLTIKVKPNKVREVIGKGGATIRSITEKTGVSIDIEDDGAIKIAAVDQDAAAEAQAMIEDIVAEIEVGAVYTGRIVKIMDFGAFISLMPGKDGFLHISQIKHERVHNIAEELDEGQEVTVKVIEIDRQGRVRVSMKELSGRV